MGHLAFFVWFGFVGLFGFFFSMLWFTNDLLRQNFQLGWTCAQCNSRKKDKTRAVVCESRYEAAKAHSDKPYLCSHIFLWLLCQYYGIIPFLLIQGSFYESFIFIHWSEYLFQMRESGLPSGLIQQMSCMALQSYNTNSRNSRTSLQVSGVPTEIRALTSTYKSKPEPSTPSTTKMLT